MDNHMNDNANVALSILTVASSGAGVYAAASQNWNVFAGALVCAWGFFGIQWARNR